MTEGKERRFIAGLLSCKVDSEGKRLATFYIMNTSRNRNRWGVSDQSLEEALPTLRGKALGMGKGYKIDKHYPEGETMDCGAFVGYEKPGAYALGTAKVDDEQTWSMMKEGKLGPISVVIYSFRDVCSSCGENLSELKDPYGEHKCLAEGDGYAVVESFQFKRVDFVDEPAYPQAGLLEMAKAEGRAIPIELLAGVYESQGHPKGFTKTGVKSLPEKNELETKLATLEQENSKLKTDFEAAKQAAADKDKENKDLKAKLEKAPTSDEIKELKDKLAAIEKEKHDALVAETLKARKDAGVAGKEDEEKAMLAKLSDDVLVVWKADALRVASITHEPAAPKTRYNQKTEEEPLQAAVAEMRAKLGLPQKPKEKT